MIQVVECNVKNQNLAIKYFDHLIQTLDQPVYGQVANAQFMELNKGKWKIFMVNCFMKNG